MLTVMNCRLSDYYATDFGHRVLLLTYAADSILFLDIVVSVRTAIVTPHGIDSMLTLRTGFVETRDPGKVWKVQEFNVEICRRAFTNCDECCISIAVITMAYQIANNVH